MQITSRLNPSPGLSIREGGHNGTGEDSRTPHQLPFALLLPMTMLKSPSLGRLLSFHHWLSEGCHAGHVPNPGTESDCSWLNWTENLLNSQAQTSRALSLFFFFFNMSIVLVMKIFDSNFNQHLLLFQHIPLVKGKDDFPVSDDSDTDMNLKYASSF